MTKRLIELLFIVFLLTKWTDLFSKTPILYVTTRSTEKFKLNSQDNPTIGLFSTADRGKTWSHYGWKYGKFFSAATAWQDGKQVFYQAAGNGIFKSEDGGKSWKITTGWNMTECLKVVIDPVNPNTVYAATAYGIFKTSDGGQTWQEKNVGLASTFTPTLVIDKNIPRLLFCATENGIHRSQDAGEKWEPIALLGMGIRTIVQHPQFAELLAVGTEENGIFISTDSGTTWQKKNIGLTHQTIYALAFSPKDKNIIYAGTFAGGIFRTDNGGESWRPVNQNLRILDIHALVVDPIKTEIVFAGTLNDGVWMSTNGGESWEFIGLETSQVWDMFIL